MKEQDIHIRQQLRRGEFLLDVDLRIPGQGVTALFGRSGSGKTSLLRCIAGLEPRARGEVSVRGQVWQNDVLMLPTHRRSLGYVVQETSLFPHLSVQGNLDFARKRAPDSPLDQEQVIAMLNLGDLLRRSVQQLSGGERQRVAIGRALLSGPEILLLDEPMASLDRRSKAEILPYLEHLHRQLAIPVIYVSHSVEEVARLADQLLVMEAGRIVGQGSLQEMMARPDFPLQPGDEAGVVWEAEAGSYDARWQLALMHTPGGDLWVRSGPETPQPGARLHILARDVSLALSRHEDSSILNILPGVIEEIGTEENSSSALVRVRMQKAALLARITLRSVDRLELVPGCSVWVQIKSVALVT